jgi:hypothetical protein
MFEQLAEAIDELESPVDGAGLAALLAERDRLEARIAEAVGSFDAAQSWALDHATSMTAWLRSVCGLGAGAAASLARTGGLLRSLPMVRSAWSSGALSGGQVAAIVANVSERSVSLFATHEPELVPDLVPLSVRETGVAMQAWRARAEAILGGGGGREPSTERSLHLSRTFGGQGELRGSLDAMSTTTVETALRLAASDDGEGESRTPGERRADALVDVCRYFLDHQTTKLGRRHRPHVNVVLGVDGLGRTLDGVLVDDAAVRTMLCDGALHRVLTDGRSTILDYGTATRVVSAALFTAVALRDGHCRHPGCDRPATWCEAHHVVPVEQHGPTSLANLVLKCSRHHHLGHRPGWSEKLKPDGSLVIRAPDGREWTTRPMGTLQLAA